MYLFGVYSITSIIPSVMYLAIGVICFLISPSRTFHFLDNSFAFLFSLIYPIILLARYTGNSCSFEIANLSHSSFSMIPIELRSCLFVKLYNYVIQIAR